MGPREMGARAAREIRGRGARAAREKRSREAGVQQCASRASACGSPACLWSPWVPSLPSLLPGCPRAHLPGLLHQAGRQGAILSLSIILYDASIVGTTIADIDIGIINYQSIEWNLPGYEINKLFYALLYWHSYWSEI